MAEIPEGAFARNPETGERWQRQNGKWVPTTPLQDAGFYAEDAGKSLGIGLARGTAQLAGAPVDILDMAQRGIHAAGDWLTGYEPTPEDIAYREGTYAGNVVPLGSEDIRNAAYDLTGVTYEPKTTLGQYFETAGEFAPAVIAGPGGAGRKLAMTVLPSAATESAGQIAHAFAPKYEGVARMGTALLTGGLGSIKAKPTGWKGMVREAVEGVTDEQFAEAAALRRSIMERTGIDIGPQQALDEVTGGSTGLGQIGQMTEQTQRGGPRMKRFYNQQERQFQEAAPKVIDEIAPASMTPLEVGPKVTKAAESTLKRARQAINRRAEPYYQAAETQPLDPAVYGPLAADRHFKKLAKQVLKDPAKDRYTQRRPPVFISTADQVMKQADAAVKEAFGASPKKGAIGNSASNAAMKDEIRTALATNPDYAEALRIERFGHENILNPMQQSVVGKLADATTDSSRASTLMPKTPEQNYYADLGHRVRQLRREDPQAMAEFVSEQLRKLWGEATQRIQGGQNQWGANRFANEVAGNVHQKKALETLIRGVGGDKAWEGFELLLRAGFAQGRRRQAGSPTAPLQKLQEQSKSSGALGEGVKVAGSPTRVLNLIGNWLDQKSFSRASKGLSKILTSPTGIEALQRLAAAGTATAKGRALLSTLITAMGQEDSPLLTNAPPDYELLQDLEGNPVYRKKGTAPPGYKPWREPLPQSQ